MKKLFLILNVLATTSFCEAAQANLEQKIPEITWSDLREVKFIGYGSFSEFFSGFWQEKKVFVKKLYKQVFSEENLNDFNMESKILWQNQSPYIVEFLCICKEKGNYSIIFEFMDNGSLQKFLCNGKQVSGERKWQIAENIARALVYLHSKKIYHSNLKSLNVLLDKNYFAKICDFGFENLKLQTNAIINHHKFSTIRWAAPEQFNNIREVSFSADIYAYGTILWELITRKIPYENEFDEMQVCFKISKGLKQDIPDNCHPVLKKIIEDCWKSTPTDRPTAEEILNRLVSAHQENVEEAETKESYFSISSFTPQEEKGIADLYLWFSKIKLIYKNPNKKEEKEWLFSDLKNPFQGEFDLSDCDENTQKFISINTGFKTIKNPDHKKKWEVWIMLKSMAEAHITKKNENYYKILNNWPDKCRLGIIWTDGDSDPYIGHYDYLVNNKDLQISSFNLYEQWYTSSCKGALNQKEATEQLEKCYQQIYFTLVPPDIHVLPARIDSKEQVLKKFMTGRLIYTHPKTGKNTEWRFADLKNVLQGEFDLSTCDKYVKKYLSINTGFRTNKNKDHKEKLEVWIMPRFFLEECIENSGKHYKNVFKVWDQEIPIGIFWTAGDWKSGDGDCVYLVTQGYEEISNQNLYEKARSTKETDLCKKIPVHPSFVKKPRFQFSF